MSTSPSTPWAVLGIGVVLLALGIVGALAWRTVSVQQVDAADAAQRFTDATADIASSRPLVQRNAAGEFIRRPAPAAIGVPAQRLYVLAYRAAAQRILSADVPLWFYKVKGPAAAYVFRDTQFDLEALGLTAADLEQAGAAVVVDETSSNGDRLLAWTR